MNRRVTTILLLLIGGAIVNVAVAWGFSCRTPPISLLARSYNHGCQLDEEVKIADADWLAKAARSQEISGRPVSYYAIASHVRQVGSMYSKYLSPSSLHLSVFEGSFGWPFLSLAGGTYTKFPASTDAGYSLQAAWVWSVANLERSRIDRRFRCSLPLLPLWPGFAINTIFYAAILWVLFFVPGKLKRNAPPQARPLPGVCVSGWNVVSLHRMRRGGSRDTTVIHARVPLNRTVESLQSVCNPQSVLSILRTSCRFAESRFDSDDSNRVRRIALQTAESNLNPQDLKPIHRIESVFNVPARLSASIRAFHLK